MDVDFKVRMVQAKQAGKTGARGPRPGPAASRSSEGYSRIIPGKCERRSSSSI